MPSVTVNINGSEQLIKITLVKKIGQYFNLFCFNTPRNKSITLKGAKNGFEIMKWLENASEQGIINSEVLSSIDLKNSIDKLQCNEVIDDISISIALKG